MSGVADVRDCLMRPRREVAVSPPSTLKKIEIVETSIFASLSEGHRITKAGNKFADLKSKERKRFYKEDVDHVVDCPTTHLTAFDAAMRVAILHKIVVVDCDRGRIKTTVNSTLVATDHLNKLSISEAHATANDVVLHSDEKRSRAASSRHDVDARRNVDDGKNNFRRASYNDR